MPLHPIRPDTGMLTISAAARRRGVTRATIERWLLRGTLTGCEVGGRIYVTLQSLDAVTNRPAVARLSAEPRPAA